jgi:beta-galactosidase/beta-glucuronidase
LKSDEIAFLSFESVNLLSDVWVNEYPVMMDHLGLFPFKMEITDELKAFYAGNPVMAVRVSGIPSNMPGMFYNGFQFDYISNPRYTKGKGEMAWDDRTSSGIADEVTLTILNKNHIDNAFIYTEDITEKEALIRFDIDLKNYTWDTFKGMVKIEISRWLPEESGIIKQEEMPISILPMGNQMSGISVILDNPSLWTVENPNMYLAHIVLYGEDNKPIDDKYETFGVRIIKMIGHNHYLNNEKIILRGTHDVCHYYGESDIAPSDRIIVEDMLLHKKMGANCSRWPSDARMHYQKIAEYCDQFGFMLIWAGFFEIWNIHPEAEMYNARDVKAMVRSLRNHPSIIVWEMGDEVLAIGHEYRRVQWYSQIYDLVAAEDKTRPVIPCGAWCNAWADYIMSRIKNNDRDRRLPLNELRKQILDEFPYITVNWLYWIYINVLIMY